MKRQFLNSGSYRYLVELYDAKNDLKQNSHTNKYVVLRKYDFVQNIVVDTEFYFIEYSLYKKYVKDLILNSEDILNPITTSNLLSFTCSNYITMTFSSNSNDWNETFTNDSLFIDPQIIYEQNNNGDYLKIEDKYYKIKSSLRYTLYSEENNIYKRNNDGDYLKIVKNNIPYYHKITPSNRYFADVSFELGKDVYKLYEANGKDIIDENKNSINIISDEDTSSNETNIDNEFNIETDDNLAKIQCDRIKIYHPDVKQLTKSIVYIYTTINNIKYNFICKTYDQFPCDAYENIVQNHVNYSEYIYIDIPNLESLFSENIYIKENLNLIYLDALNENSKKVFDDEVSKTIREHEISDLQSQFIKFNLLLQPFKISEITYLNSNNETVTENIKVYKRYHINSKKLKLHPLNIILYPYNELDDKSNMYNYNNNYDISSTSFISSSKFSLKAKLGFNDDKLSVISEFDYPKDLYNSDTSIFDAYVDYYSIDLENDYTFNINEGFNNEKKKIEELYNESYNLTENDKAVLNSILSTDPKYNKLLDTVKNKVDLLKQLKIEALISEYKEEFGVDASFIGYQLKIFSDKNCTRCIYSDERTLDELCENDETLRMASITEKLKHCLQDFSFPLTDIFESWEQMPNDLVCYTQFIDRFLGITLLSNILIITKNWFKYMINNSSNRIFRLNSLSKINQDYINDMKVINEENTNFSFINSINCSVISHNLDEENYSSSVNRSNSPRVIYKPIFFKVQPLQNINLRRNMNQNIGINLMQYMTKVETFKMIINNIEIIESSRNEGYVIFNITTTSFPNTMGIYDIVDQDNTYIASGNFSLY